MTPATKQPDSSLRTRLKSAAVLAVVVAVMVWAGGWGFTLLMAAAAAVGAWEWTRMVTTGAENVPPHMARVAGAMTGIGALGMGMVDNPVIALYFLLSLCFLIFAYNFSQKGPPVRLVLFGVVYIGFSTGIMIWLRGGTSVQGLYDIATLLAIVWGSDTFAYATGRTLGGPKLAPAISPKKTWSGLLGGSAGAALVAALLALPWVTYTLDVDTVGGMTSVGYAVMGAVLGVCGQGGDLFISVFKRHYGIKDTGTLIPGHGGILDRIDALLFVTYLFGSLAMATS